MGWFTKKNVLSESDIAYNNGLNYCYNAFKTLKPHVDIICHLQNTYASEKHDHEAYAIFNNAIEAYSSKANARMYALMTLEQPIEEARLHVEKYRDYFELNIDIDITLGKFYYPKLSYSQTYMSERQDAARKWLKYMKKHCTNEAMIYKLFKSYTGDSKGFIPFTSFEFFNLHGTKS